MEAQTTFAFAEQAESLLQAIRGGILVWRQEGRKAELVGQLRGIASLSESAKLHGQMSIGEVFDAIEQESSRFLSSEAPLSDADSRDLLDLIAYAEAEVVKARQGSDDHSMNVADFIEQSFDILQMDSFLQNSSTEEANDVVVFTEAVVPEEVPAATEEAEDEFEIDAEMLEIFAMEAEDLLGNIETNLELLIATPTNRDALWEIRRNAHTFKGAAGIVGFKKPSQLAHRVEDLLDHLAQNEIAPNQKILDLLTSSAKCLRSITGGDMSPSLMARMNEVYLAFDDVMTELTTEKTAEPAPEPEPVAATPIEIVPQIELPAEAQPVQARPIVRVSITRLDELVRIVRDLVVSRSVVEQRIWEFERQIEELHNTTRRLQTISAKIETDFEASMLGTQPAVSFGGAQYSTNHEMQADDREDFDSLELDRYTDFHQSARELSEATNDSFSINTALEALKGSLEIVFEDQRRLIEEMQEKVMQIRLIRFGSLTTRLQRAVSVTCEEEIKNAEVVIENQDVEIDTDVLDSLVEPVMHLLRNAVVHGIESSDTRRLLGKPETGNIVVRVRNDETHIVLQVSDDGRGIAGSVLKDKAVSAGLISAETAKMLDPQGMLDLMFLPGLTTAEKLSMSAGRGVGMSIVKESIEAKKGTISIETVPQGGTTFTVRIPLAYAVAQVLLVKVEHQTLAIPLKIVKHIAEFSPSDLQTDGGEQVLEIESVKFPVAFLADYIDASRHDQADNEFANTLLIDTGNIKCALMVDEILKTEEIGIKTLGKPLENLNGLLGAAVLGSGEVVPILDLQFLLKNKPKAAADMESKASTARDTLRILVVDDSPSVRHMTSKVIVGAGWEVLTAKDGLEAFEMLQASPELPSVVLTDVEMPRMDGYELIKALKESETLCELPVVLITSRSGEKHRERALDLGISDYLAKPYDDSELIETVKRLANKYPKTVSPEIAHDVPVLEELPVFDLF
ncbi:MAG: response regulator [Pyrinomonadaceae bacterium]